jgi:hypothetical protein
MSLLRRPIALLLFPLVLSCADAPAGGGSGSLFFPTYSPSTESPLAAPQGVLVVRDDCLFMEASSGGTFLLLWPDGWSAGTESGGVRIFDGQGRQVAAEGEEATFQGGERTIASAESLSGEEVPSRCRSDPAWLVVEVLH